MCLFVCLFVSASHVAKADLTLITQCITEAGPEFVMLLPPTRTYKDCGYASLHPASVYAFSKKGYSSLAETPKYSLVNKNAPILMRV